MRPNDLRTTNMVNLAEYVCPGAPSSLWWSCAHGHWPAAVQRGAMNTFTLAHDFAITWSFPAGILAIFSVACLLTSCHTSTVCQRCLDIDPCVTVHLSRVAVHLSWVLSRVMVHLSWVMGACEGYDPFWNGSRLFTQIGAVCDEFWPNFAQTTREHAKNIQLTRIMRIAPRILFKLHWGVKRALATIWNGIWAVLALPIRVWDNFWLEMEWWLLADLGKVS